jgi:peptidoglycan/xylan/chitin deacetylase (PgdA/CDA1 family)
MSYFEVLLGFDMETDIGSWTPYYEGLHHGTPRVLDLLARHEVSGTFYFVGQCAKELPHIVRRCRDVGHEIGAHSLYHETVGDSLFPIPGIYPLLSHEVKPRLELCTQWIEEAGGVRPRSFRSPRLFGSTSVCNALEELDYLSDASYPLYFYKERLAPYHPHADDWTREGDLGLVEIPNFADLSIPSNDAYGRDRDQWPKFRTGSAASILTHVDNFLNYLEEQKVTRKVVAFYLHPWEFHPMPEGLIHFGEGSVLPDPFLTKNCGDIALRELDALIRGIKTRGGEFRTAAQIALS